MSAFGIAIESRTVPPLQRGHDAKARWSLSLLLTIPQADPVARRVLQFTAEIGSRAKDKRFKERQLPFFLAHFLPLEQRLELLGFTVGADQWIIDRDQPTIRLPGPRSSIAE